MKITFIVLIAVCLSFFASAQSEQAPPATNNLFLNHQSTTSPLKAHWDVQLSFNATDSAAGSIGQAAIALVNNEIWTSKWASDTMIRFDIDGTMIEKFSIAGLTGTRSITSDGTYLYFGTNTNTIYRVDPVTKTLAPPHITSAAINTSRFLTYDATLNGGAGGFWSGNFNTDIEAISMTGTLLTSIPATTHTLTGMYGAAVDNYSTGGPYLWVFHQGGANNSQVTAISLTTGLPTTFTYDMFPVLQSIYGSTSGLAGGCFVTNQLIPGEVSFMGLFQGTPENIVFAIELDPTVIIDDIIAVSLRPQHGYTQIPASQVFVENFEAGFRLDGPNVPDTVYAELNYYFEGTITGSDHLYATGLSINGSDTLIADFDPTNGVGQYTVELILSGSSSFTDGDQLNDTLRFNFEVTDSVFARDNGISNGTPYNVSTVDWAYAASMYELFQPDTIEAIWIQLETPFDGDTTFGIIYSISGGVPSTFVAASDTTIISSTINTYELTFSSPVILPAGQYAFGCYEGSNTTINLSQSNDLYTAGMNFFYLGSTLSWSGSSIPTARFIHPVFFRQTVDAIDESLALHFNVYPVPANDAINITFTNPTDQHSLVQIIDNTGRIISSMQVLPNSTQQQIDISNIASGYYYINWIHHSGTETAPIIIE